MKKSDLKQGMIVKCSDVKFGIVDLENQRIVFYFYASAGEYYPNNIANTPSEIVKLEHVFDLEDGGIGVGFKVTEKMIKNNPKKYSEDDLGKIIVYYRITEVYDVINVYKEE